MEDHNKKYIPSDSADQPSTSKPESGTQERFKILEDQYRDDAIPEIEYRMGLRAIIEELEAKNHVLQIQVTGIKSEIRALEYERARVRPATHDTIVLEWDEKGNVTYCRTFDFPNDEVNARAAIASVGLNKRRYIIGKIDGILHLSKFKEDEDE